MADRYWIANLEANQLWTTATNWADNADGTGANTVPVANDNVHFGHATTLAAGKGFGLCELAGATAALAKFTSYEGYNQVQVINNFTINASGKFIPNPATGFSLEQLGFRVGMVIIVSGAANAGNNSTFEISSLGSNEITVTSATGMVTEGTAVELTITYDPSLDLKGQVLNMTGTGGTLMYVDSKIINSVGSISTINLTGSFVGGSSNRYFLCGSNQTFVGRSKINMVITNSNSKGVLYFDDGIYPMVELNGGNFSCDYVPPTSSIHGAVKFYQFKEAVLNTWDSGLNSKRDNSKKIFQVERTTSFALLSVDFDTGQSTWSFDTNTSFVIPTSGDYIDYPTGFTVRWYNLIIKNSGGNPSHKALVPARRNLQVNSLTIESAGQVIGELTESLSGTIYKGSSTITSVNRPTVKGAWNFSQVADGVYASLLTESYSITPSHGDKGAIQFSYGGGAFHSHSKMKVITNDWEDNNKLLLDEGAYLSSGWMMFNQNYAPASGTGANNAIWSSNDSPTVLYYTDSGGTHHNLLAGGGGSGTVTSIATTAPITGGTITTTGTIGISAATTIAAGSMSAADKTKLDLINQSVASGASPNFTTTNMTDASNKRFMTDAQEAKLDGLASPFEHVRLALTNNALMTQSSGTNYYLDLANTGDFSNTGNTTNIIATAAAQDYVLLKAGGMYMVVASVEIFTGANTAAQDFWLQLGNGTSSNSQRRNWGTSRMKRAPSPSSADSAVNLQKTVIIDVASTGSDEKVYVIALVNGAAFTVKAYDNNRTNITITRIGVSTS